MNWVSTGGWTGITKVVVGIGVSEDDINRSLPLRRHPEQPGGEASRTEERRPCLANDAVCVGHYGSLHS